MPPFVPIQKKRSPSDNEKTCPKCNGTGSFNTHVCPACHGATVVSKDWKPGDGTVKPGDKSTNKGISGPKGRTA